jgi:hypothetical protein
MRLGRVPLLGIDYGTTPSSFGSSEARRYAREGNHEHAALAEMLCDLYKDRPDESDGLFHSWELQVGMLSSRFGENWEEALELIRAECDPSYAHAELTEPELPPQQYVPQEAQIKAYHNLQAKGMTAAPVSMSPVASYGSYAGT